MGERQSDGGLAGRASRHALLDSEVEALIAASLIRDGVDAEAEQRAVAAFRAARDDGAHRTRTRLRDDWRPRERRRYLGLSLRTTLGVLFASLTLGGVAVAAIGAAGSPADGPDDGRGHPPATSGTPSDPARTPSRGGDPGRPSGTATGSAPTRPDRPAPAQDTEAHCRAYQQVEGRGRAMDATAWQRLVDAAGGERNVTRYCAAQLERSTPEPKPTQSGGSENSGASENSGTSGNKGSGENNGTDKGQDKSTPARPNGRSQ
ncbi:conserved hypothetical protein [Streptomyces viridochromogenes DSM 40736]|uniref:Uncharacterized protein n=1 Tax=Streptomyces viridochromogenes (strain DSM 40736 / JCM 4977 / BCRC 1201 / Tue 494) TaxID=591159 RepID=D9XB88_STRVT|nr:hypothetical protein [Streptomyces viridochromogenes]EFL34429.1 conserved hypothetical protein [Streptomyces viridochromogenes DSM 40736]